jgi:hypothetical protein
MSTLGTIKNKLDELLLEPGQSSLSAIENAAQLLRQFREEAERSTPPVTSPQAETDFTESPFTALQMGASPPELHEAVRRAWDGVERQWACASTVQEFFEELKRLHEPLKGDAHTLDAKESNATLAERRLETLNCLRDLLDELVTTGRDEEEEGDQPS